ncbi:hypothetical protein ACFLV0_05530 [Chloroflexota bacterium]
MNLKISNDRLVGSPFAAKMSKRIKRREQARLPVATVAYYGPDDKTPTKVAVGIVTEWEKGPAELKRWWGQNVAHDAGIQ